MKIKGSSSGVAPIAVRDSKQMGVALTRVRRKQRLTQAMLSEQAGILQKTVSTAERGEAGTQLRTIFKLLAALNLELVVRQRG